MKLPVCHTLCLFIRLFRVDAKDLCVGDILSADTILSDLVRRRKRHCKAFETYIYSQYLITPKLLTATSMMQKQKRLQRFPN